MKHPFRQYHLLTILEEYEQQGLPLDLFLSSYFRAHKAVGSKDRAYIAETAYNVVRWQGLIDYVCPKNQSWDECLEFFISPDFEAAKQNEEIPLHIRLSYPKVLFDHLVESHGIDKACEICTISNTPAPTTVRINTLKASREEMFQKWKEKYPVRLCQYAPNGIVFEKRINFFDLPEFKAGLFEVQDEGSQQLAELVQAEPGQLVMDYCAGAGGKTLAFAPRMQNKGQIYLHDIRKNALQDSKKRLRRAGIQNAQIVLADESKLSKLKKSMDWVLVDAPCTGTGTMRRNPDMKWNFDEGMVERLVGQQRVIFEKALSFLKPQGKIVFATCSVLKEENREQAAHFLKTYNLKMVADPFESLPVLNGMDGFFGVVLTRI